MIGSRQTILGVDLEFQALQIDLPLHCVLHKVFSNWVFFLLDERHDQQEMDISSTPQSGEANVMKKLLKN